MQLGNLHPLFVHLPIGILLLAFLMELFYAKKPAPKDNGTILFTLGIGAASSVFSIISGWLLGDNGGYDEALLDKHRWIAVAFAVGAIGLYFLKKSSKKQLQKAYMPIFVVVLLLLTLTGHYGGSLTHGEDFLFAEKYEEPVIENIDEAKVFAEVVQPILNKKCVSCHNSGKAKGGLLLTSQGELLSGGDSGALLDSLPKEGTSLLMHRIHLPETEEEHMPPKGKVQLTSEEVLLLEWWMTNNNCFDCLVKDLPHTGKLEPVLASLEKDTSSQAQIAEKVDGVPADFMVSLATNKLSAQLLSEEMPLLSINFMQRKDVSLEDFELLKKHKENIVELNLAYTNFDDELAKQLKPFKNLIKLQLQNTQITNEGAKQLKGFKFLETLNLFGTDLDDASLARISDLPNLKKLYVWQTQMTAEGLTSFKQGNQTVAIQGQIADSVFAASSLGPPTIIAEHEIFRDSVQV
ncbi:MAG: c-type cytochrome domain-containing protein, partial [Bacteroidota bacterium]